MVGISEALKEELICDLPVFRENARKFFDGEISVKDYKGLSGPFGSYAEKGAETGMSRWRFPAGRITHPQLIFMAETIRRYDLRHIHFTTGQAIQFHRLQGETIADIFAACHAHGIYNRGAGGDHPRNIAGYPLRGIDPRETWDTTPYIEAAAAYILSLIKGIKLPRKYKVAFSSDAHNESHVTFKDLGFKAMPDRTFEVYAAGGLGPNPKLGVKVAEGVAPEKILYYITAMARLFAEHGNYTNRAKARTRYLQTAFGDPDGLREKFAEYLRDVLSEGGLDIDPASYTTACTKEGIPDDTFCHPRVGAQKQRGLYYVKYHPIGGNPEREVLLRILDYLGGAEEAEGRLTSDEGIYFINLTAEEARAVLDLTEDSAENSFEESVSCVGASLCQVGSQDSNGLLHEIVARTRKAGVSSARLPRIHISGCLSSCGTHQIGEIGFHGATKLIDKVPTPSFILVFGGSENFGTERFGMPMGNIIAAAIPDFFVELAELLTRDEAADFRTWQTAHADSFAELVKKYEAIRPQQNHGNRA